MEVDASHAIFEVEVPEEWTGKTVGGLPQTGIVDYPTWYKISEIYVGVSRIAELNP